MQHRALSLVASILACCAASGASNSAPIVASAGFAATLPSKSQIEHVWCCRYHRHSAHYYRGLRWYWTTRPYNCHFDLYYGYSAAHSIREKPCRS